MIVTATAFIVLLGRYMMKDSIYARIGYLTFWENKRNPTIFKYV